MNSCRMRTTTWQEVLGQSGNGMSTFSVDLPRLTTKQGKRKVSDFWHSPHRTEYETSAQNVISEPFGSIILIAFNERIRR